MTYPKKEKLNIYHALENFCNGLDEDSIRYLTGTKRGLIEKTIKHFRLFSINNLKDTIDFLFENFTSDELKASGLLNEKGKFVFSNHKIIIPYITNDDIVYLRGRYLPKDDEDDIDNKYIGLAGQRAKRFYNLNALRGLSDKSDLLNL